MFRQDAVKCVYHLLTVGLLTLLKEIFKYFLRRACVTPLILVIVTHHLSICLVPFGVLLLQNLCTLLRLQVLGSFGFQIWSFLYLWLDREALSDSFIQALSKVLLLFLFNWRRLITQVLFVQLGIILLSIFHARVTAVAGLAFAQLEFLEGPNLLDMFSAELCR